MRIPDFAVRNQRNIHLATCEKVPPVMIVTGPNGCGKSTLLQALRTAPGEPGPILYVGPHRSSTRHSALWQEISNVPPLHAEQKRRRSPKLPTEAWAIREALGDSAGAMWWTLCTTGMRVRSEYIEGEWRVKGNRLIIRSAKSQDKLRIVPLITPPTEPTLTYWGFRQALRRLDVPVAPHDGRRSYMNWLREAGVPRIRRELYLGHGPRDVSDLYEWHEVEKFVEADSHRLLRYLGKQDNMVRLVR